jgi:ankyrin repeat protein
VAEEQQTNLVIRAKERGGSALTRLPLGSDFVNYMQAGAMWTPLQLAAFRGLGTACRTLLAAGADPTARAVGAVSVAGWHGRGRLKPHVSRATRWHCLTVQHLPPSPSALTALNLQPGGGHSHQPLHLAARYGHAEAAEALCEGGVDPNAADEVRHGA